jgi:hypothetical protein
MQVGEAGAAPLVMYGKKMSRSSSKHHLHDRDIYRVDKGRKCRQVESGRVG